MSDNSGSDSEFECKWYDSDTSSEGSNRITTARLQNELNEIKEIIGYFKNKEPEYGGSYEYENEAVSMAIRQHGLKNNGSEINENYNKDDGGEETTSDDTIEDNLCSVRKEKRRCHSSDIQNTAYNQNLKSNSEFDDDEDNEFLSEAVSVAIRKKGLSSSSSSKPLQ